MKTIDELLHAPYWIIDILPQRVPKDSPGQYFAVEDYYLNEHLGAIKQKHINLVLKLNCYMDITLEKEINPPPARIAEVMNKQYVYIIIENAMILSGPDDTYLTLFNPDKRILGVVREIAASEGLYVWMGDEKRSD